MIADLQPPCIPIRSLWETVRRVIDAVAQGCSDVVAQIPAALAAAMLFDAGDRVAQAAHFGDDLTFLRGHDDLLLTFTERTAIKISSVRQWAQGA